MLFDMLAALFAGWGAVKAAPAIIQSELWEQTETGEWIRVAYTVATPPDGPTVSYELLDEEMKVVLKTDGFATARYAPLGDHKFPEVR